VATLLRELFHDVSRRASEIASELSKMTGNVPSEVEAYRARMEQMASRAATFASMMSADPDLDDPNFAVNFFRDYKGVARLVQSLEHLPLLVLRRFSEPDQRMTAVVARICDEIDYPYEAPVCSSLSSQYFWTVAGMDLIFVPCLEPDHLLGLPDMYHELGHIILFREERAFIFPALSIVDRHFDKLVADGLRGNWPLQSIEQLEEFRHRWRLSWLIEFGADLIATYTSGPVFGWCNIRTSTNLGGELFGGNETHPADDARSTMVGLMLDRMGEGDAAERIRIRWSELVSLSGESRPPRYELAYPATLQQELIEFLYLECERLGLRRWEARAAATTVGGSVDAAWETFRNHPANFGDHERHSLAALMSKIDSSSTPIST
jgi:hypothetical protein